MYRAHAGSSPITVFGLVDIQDCTFCQALLCVVQCLLDFDLYLKAQLRYGQFHVARLLSPLVKINGVHQGRSFDSESGNAMPSNGVSMHLLEIVVRKCYVVHVDRISSLLHSFEQQP